MLIRVNGRFIRISKVLLVWWNVRYNRMKMIIIVIGIISFNFLLVCLSNLNCFENVILVFGFSFIFLLMVVLILFIIDIMFLLWVLI